MDWCHRAGMQVSCGLHMRMAPAFYHACCHAGAILGRTRRASRTAALEAPASILISVGGNWASAGITGERTAASTPNTCRAAQRAPPALPTFPPLTLLPQSQPTHHRRNGSDGRYRVRLPPAHVASGTSVPAAPPTRLSASAELCLCRADAGCPASAR